MDWIALASVLSSAVVASLTLVTNAMTKRGDRKHAFALDFAKRNWEPKSAALVSLIWKCEGLKSRHIRYCEDPEENAAHRRAIVLMQFDEMRMDLRDEPGAALLAYADKSVRDPANRLSTTLSREISGNWSAVMEIRRLREETEAAAAKEGEDPIPWARLIVQLHKAEIDLGQHSTLDVDEIDKLCHNILDAARKDLRGS